MRSLTSVSRRSLTRRKGRYALTAFGIALGVGIVFSVLLTTAATNRAFDRFVNGWSGRADVVVQPAGAFGSRLDPALVAGVSAAPEVERVVERYLFRTSEALPGVDVDFRDFLFVSGLDFSVATQVHTFALADGRLPEPGRPEVVVTRVLETAAGSQLTLATETGRRRVQVVGVLEERGAALADGGRVVFTSIETARELQDRPGEINQLDVVLAPGTDAAGWIDDRRADLGEGAVFQEASELGGFFRQFLSSIQGAMLIIAAIALFVGAFMIFLTFSVTVAERTRFFGTLRALGALPGQVRRLVVGEALWLGLVSAAAGLMLGYAISVVSVGAVDALLSLGDVSIEDPWVPGLFGLVLGVVVSVMSAVVPARRAGALSPVAAMRDHGVEADERVRLGPRLAVLLVGLGVSALGEGAGFQSVGAIIILLGAVLLVPVILRPAARVLGVITSRLGRGVGEIAVMHLAKERSRSAYTLALLMAVLAATIAIGAGNVSMANTLDEVVDRQFGADLQISAPNTFGPEFGERLAAVEGIGQRSEMRFGHSEILDESGAREAFVMVIDPATYFDISSLPWDEGSDEQAATALAAGGSVVLDTPAAEAIGAEVGDPVPLRTTEGVSELTLVGTYRVLGFNAGAVVSQRDGARLFGAGNPMGYLLDVDDGHRVDDVKAAIRSGLADDFDFELETAADIKAFAQEQLSGFFGIAYAVLLVSIVIGILGLANTLAVSVIQRTREIGILRSTGVLRRQLRAMVLAEAGTLVLVAWFLSLPLGWVLTRVTVSAFGSSLGFSIDFLWPWAFVPPLFAVALFGAAVASIGPARRAARLDPVVALRFD